jgi:gluconolactonase
MYFTDPLYERDYWINFKQEIPHKSLYYRNKEGRFKLETFTQPNGIVGSEKLKKLYLSDIDAGKPMFMIFWEKENYLRKNYSVKWVQTE